MARSLRTSAIVFGCLAVLLVLAAVGGITWLRSEGGRSWILAQIAQVVRDETGLELAIGKLEGDLLNTMVLQQVTIADGAGPWLALERARIEWRPWDLAGGRLHILSLDALAVDITRTPDLPEDPPERPGDAPATGGGPSLPIDVSLDRFSAQPVILGEALLGEPATLKVEGRLAASEGELLSARLTVVRHDGPGGTLEADTAYRLSDRTLEATLTLTEPSGALARRLSGLDQAGATTVKIAGSGSLADLQGKLDAEVEGLGAAGSSFRLILEDELRLKASGQLRSDWRPNGVPSEIWDRDMSFALDVALSDGTLLTAESLELESSVAAVRAKGELDTASRAVAATADIEIKDQAALAALIAPVKVAGPEFALALAGTLEQPRLEIQAVVAALSVPGLQSKRAGAAVSLTPAPGGALDDLELTFSGHGQVAGLGIEGLAELSPLLEPELAWQADGTIDLRQEAVSLSQVRVVGEEIIVTAFGSADFTPGLDLDTTVDLTDIAALENLIGFSPAGRLEVVAKLRSRDLDSGIDASIDGRLSDFALGEETLDLVLGPGPRFEVDLTLPGYERVELSDLTAELRTGKLTGDLDIDLRDSELSGEIGFAAQDLSVFRPLIGEPLSGAGRLQATVSGPLEDPAAKGRLRLSDVSVGPLVPSDLTADFTSRTLVSAPKGQISLALEAPQMTLEAKSGFELADRDLRLTGLSLQGDGVSADGDLRVPLAGPPVQGQLTVRIADLAPSLSLLALDGTGTGLAQVELGREGGRQTLAMTGEVDGLSLFLTTETALSVKAARLSAASPDLFAGGLSDLSLDMKDVKAGGVILDSLGLTGGGDLRKARFNLAAKGDLQGELALDAAGSLSLAGQRTEVALESLNGRLLGEVLALSKPARLVYGEQALRAEALRLTFGAARLDLDAEVSEANTDIRFEASSLPLALTKIALPDFQIEGTVDLQARLSGPSGSPSGSISFDARDVDLGDDLDSPPLQVTAKGTLDGKRLNLTGRLSGFAPETAVLELALPLRLAVVPFAVEVIQNQPLNGEFRWNGRLTELWAVVPVAGHRFAGPAKIDLVLSGTPAEPSAAGQVTISKGEYENFETGTLLQDLEMILDLRGNRVVVETLSANDGGDGTLKGSGQLDLNPDQDFPFSFKTDFADFTLLRRDEVTAASNGTLEAGGNLTETAVEGTFETTTIEIGIPDNLPPEIVELEVTELGTRRTGSSGPGKPARRQAGAEIGLDISITIPAKAFVRGRGLDTEWKGWLRITGSAAEPVIEGELENLRGRFRVVGKDFDLQQSKINFTGTSDLTPLLDIRAVYETDDLVVTVTVTGTPDRPTITFTSSPTLPQEEIISRVLFGKNTAQLSAFEAVQLASSVAELSGSGLGTAGAFDFTRDLLGVDVLNIGTTGGTTGGAEVSAGKYITEEVFLGVKQGTTPGSSTAEVGVELTPNISVGSEIGSGGESNIGVRFKWDY